MAWTDIPAFVLDKVFGYQSANLLRENSIALKDLPLIVQSKVAPNDFVPNAQPLDTLPTGYVKNTTGTGVLTTVALIPSTDVSGTVPAAAHKTTHQFGGVDEVNVTGLTGLLTTPQTPAAHKATHETGGSDAISALDAAVLTTGLLNIARLPDNVRHANIYFHIAAYASAGSSIATGLAGFWACPWAGEITQVTLLSIDPSVTAGDIVVDIWKDTYANYPPTAADSICASAKPALSSGIKYQDAVLTGWTKTIAPGDVLGFNVDSVSAALKHVLVELRVTLN